jgi:phenol hydroxylase P5 protein
MEIKKFVVSRHERITTEICRVWLKPQNQNDMFTFKAGQFITLHDLNEMGESTFFRYYSIASTPNQSKEMIELGVKSQGKMSGKIYNAKIGDVFGVQGPYGAFTLSKNKRTILFAGGVGVTPIKSMINESLQNDSDKELVLFYSGRSLNELVYHEEFWELTGKHSNFKYIPIITREVPRDWMGEAKRLDAEMFTKHVGEVNDDTDFIMCGPVEMMDNVKSILENMGVDVKVKLRAERY